MTARPLLRKFSLLDAIVLVAATAGALRLCMLVMSANDHGQGNDFSTPRSILDDIRQRGLFFAPIHITYWPEVAGPFLRGWTVALCLLRWLRPRPNRPRLLRQPGASATLAATAVMIAELVVWSLFIGRTLARVRVVADTLEGHRLYPVAHQGQGYVCGNVAIGMAIFAAWAVLGSSGRWRGEKSWIDRGGRLLALIWILVTPINFWRALLFR